MLNQPRRRSRPPLVVGFVLVAVAAGFLVWSVLGMVSAGSDVDRATRELADANGHLAAPSC